MQSERFNMAFKTFLGLIPIFYGGIVIAALPYTIQSAIVVGVVLITLVILVGWLDLPLHTIWPIFPGVMLIMAGSLALYLNAPTLGLTSTSFAGLLVLYLVAAFYIIWAVRATWKVSQMY